MVSQNFQLVAVEFKLTNGSGSRPEEGNPAVGVVLLVEISGSGRRAHGYDLMTLPPAVFVNPSKPDWPASDRTRR